MSGGVYAFARRALFALSPETAHGLTIRLLKSGFVKGDPHTDDKRLRVRLFGLDFPNPIGLAAGFDKNADVPDAMLKLGFGFVETGTVTPKPQSGNPRPRVFRLTPDRAVINRMGFSGKGLEAVTRRLAARAGKPGIVGANLGANRDSTDRIADYETCLRALYGHADYFTVNISSPNTPGLRALQDREALGPLLARLMEARGELTAHGTLAKPLLLKIAPDLGPSELEDVAQVALDLKVDSIILGNTTLARPPALKSRRKAETGGLSGAPLFEPSTRLLARLYRMTAGRIPLIGAGGVATGREAYEKIRAGASLVQLYTALVYEGPELIARIKKELTDHLEADGFKNVAEATGSGADDWAGRQLTS